MIVRKNQQMIRLLKQPHLLIGGSTGSGKSVLINNLIYHILQDPPTKKQMILIDPKKVELMDYQDLPHTLNYVTEIDEILAALDTAISIMIKRFKVMQRFRLKKSKEADIYIIIDEYADLVIQAKKLVEPKIIRLSQLGRAGNIHLILATQRPTRDIVTGALKVNLDSRIALRCPSPQDSRNIIDRRGAELLPKYGEAYYLEQGYLHHIKIDMIPQADLNALIDYWKPKPKFLNWLMP